MVVEGRRLIAVVTFKPQPTWLWNISLGSIYPTPCRDFRLSDHRRVPYVNRTHISKLQRCCWIITPLSIVYLQLHPCMPLKAFWQRLVFTSVVSESAMQTSDYAGRRGRKRIRHDAYTDTKRPPVSRLRWCIDNNVDEIYYCSVRNSTEWQNEICQQLHERHQYGNGPYDTIRYDTTQHIYVCSKARKKMASLI